ncbi:hypothetical protein N7495_008438 [Penicillium taxi]|uniref:uncharacterized protein n=1 Tax=Penicillium taxi TaxID=168475 RepID=UPI002545918A|nr:uncharacterized protein N7495_008438 [Penicillium taxi]KAJ5888397.1 hypothetical protein N7495_008438 [Penicillium taxi]
MFGGRTDHRSRPNATSRLLIESSGIVMSANFISNYLPRSWTRSSHESAAIAEPSSDVAPNPSSAEAGDDSASTPKASASYATSPVLAVPTLNLEESKENVAVNKSAEGPVLTDLNARKQYAKSSAPSSMPPPKRSTITDTSLMPPPPVPRLCTTPQPNRTPGGGLQPPRVSGSPRPPPSAAAGLRVPPGAGSSGLSSSTLAPTSLSLKKPSSSKRVILDPGYSPLDWAALAANPNSQLRGAGVPQGLLRVTPSMLKIQNGRKGRDAWTSYLGKVYNINPYIPYHPGGKGELLRGAGKDSGKLFLEVHPWVNWDGILNECLVGILVSENDTQDEGTLDAMD